MGADALRSHTFEAFNNNNRGTFNFLGHVTNDPFADFLLGLPDSATRQAGSPGAYLLSTTYGFFVQDDFRITPRLTLNLGLRYEIAKPPVEKYGRLANFVPSLDQIVIASGSTIPDFNALLTQANLSGKVALAASVHLPSSLVNTNYDNFAPRFGFALRPFGGVRTVVRGGYGIFYGGSLLQPIRDDLTRVYPFALSQTFNRSTTDVN
ncbi:MAG: TonB-dependent receptor, partial [Acidobacteriota bacterium]|nr:TonB-dependent receptor [Acidobacteriota bacterium]